MPNPQPIMTEAEAVAILGAAGLSLEQLPAEFQTWLTYMLDAGAVMAGQIEADYYEQLAASITSPMDPKALEAARDAWRNQARINARNLATQMLSDQLQVVGETIAKGLEEGIGPRELARRLDAVTGLDAPRAARYAAASAYLETLELPADQLAKMQSELYEKLLKERKETIARTEARFATEESQKQNAKARGAQFKVWITAGDDRVSDECQENEAAGPIPIDDTFPSGADKPPEHPNCRCTLAFYTDEDQLDEAQARADARAEKTAAAKAADQ